MISVDELVEYVRADEADYDRIEYLRDAAVAYINEPGGRYFGPTATITETIVWRGGVFQLANTPLGALTITRANGAAWDAVDTTGWIIDGRLVYGYGITAPTTGAAHFRVSYEAGYAPGFDGAYAAPDDIKQAVRMLVAHWYRHPEAVGETTEEVDWAVSAILRKYR